MGELLTYGYYKPVFGPDTYLESVGYERLLKELQDFGKQLPVVKWGPNERVPTRAEQNHLSAVETALGLAASPRQHFDNQRYRCYFDDKDCLANLGRGLAELTLRFLSRADAGFTDYHRFVQGYPLEFVMMMSKYRFNGNYQNIPPFVSSATLAFLYQSMPPIIADTGYVEPKYGEEERLF